MGSHQQGDGILPRFLRCPVQQFCRQGKVAATRACRHILVSPLGQFDRGLSALRLEADTQSRLVPNRLSGPTQHATAARAITVVN